MQLWQDNIQLRLSWALHMRGLRGNNCPPELLTGWGARRELQLMRAKTPLPPPPLTAVMCSSLLNSVLSCIYSYWSTQAFVLCNCVIIIVFLVFSLAASAQTTCHMCDLVMFDPPPSLTSREVWKPQRPQNSWKKRILRVAELWPALLCLWLACAHIFHWADWLGLGMTSEMATPSHSSCKWMLLLGRSLRENTLLLWHSA